MHSDNQKKQDTGKKMSASKQADDIISRVEKVLLPSIQSRIESVERAARSIQPIRNN